jgi:hypothetical protein
MIALVIDQDGGTSVASRSAGSAAPWTAHGGPFIFFDRTGPVDI